MNFEKDPQTDPQEQGFILIPESPQNGNCCDFQQDHFQQTTQKQKTDEPVTTKPPKVRKTGLVILLALCSISAILGLTGIVSQRKDTNDSNPFRELANFSISSSSKSHIAVLHIEGIIQDKNDTYDQQWLLATIRNLSHKRNVKALLLYIDSPGGGVYQSDEVYLELLDYKKNSGNPVWAFFGPLAASGGYYIACAADYIVANRNTLTGSIGVIAGQSVDFSQFLDKHGIQVNTFTAGRNKDMLGISTPVTSEHRDIMQSMADECYNQFVQIVAESRGITIEETLKLADGRVYTAGQAQDLGLVDQISRFDDAIQSLQEKLDNSSLETLHYYPEKKYTIMDYVLWNVKTLVSSIKADSASERLLLEAKEKMIPNLTYPAYYYQP